MDWTIPLILWFGSGASAGAVVMFTNRGQIVSLWGFVGHAAVALLMTTGGPASWVFAAVDWYKD